MSQSLVSSVDALHWTRRLSSPHKTTLAALFAVFAAVQFSPDILDLPLGLYIPVHAVMEIFAVAVASMVFSVGWNADRDLHPGRIQMVACAFLAVALLDLGHLLSVKGMPDFITPASPEKGIAFWLPGRLADAVALLLAATAWQAHRQCNRWVMLAASLGFTAAVYLVVLVWPEALPRTFIPGSGLTPFKIVAEFFIVALHLLTLLLLTRRLSEPSDFDAGGLFAATAVMAMSELFFTMYGTPHDGYILLGHVYKVIAYYLVYRTLFVSVVSRPYIELKAARRDLEDSEAMYRMLFENSLDAVLLMRADGRVHAANPAACALLRQTQEELMLLAPEEVLDAGGAQLRRLLAQRWHTGKMRGDVTLKRRDGSTFAAEIASAVYVDKARRQAVCTMLRDITGRKTAEAEILRLNRDLEDRVQQRTAELAAANEELEQFSYSVAHDLRSPLASISGFSRALEESLLPGFPERARHYLARIRAGVEQMDEMINALLGLAHVSRSEVNRELLDLAEIASQLLAARCQGDPSRVVEATVQAPLPAYGDRHLITTMMDNLIGNAWKFTAGCERAQITVGAESIDGEMVWFVKDNGAGFDMAYADNLFGVFQRLHSQSEFPGHGIGLANVRRIVARHNGRVWAEATPGQGATFRFTLGVLPD